MHGTAHKLCFLALVGMMATLAYALNYQYFSDIEITNFGDRIRFWHYDTLDGPVRSNWQLAVMQDPVFYDYVIQSGNWDDFWHGEGYNPQFLGPPPVFHAPPLPFAENAAIIRARAFEQGYYFHAGPNMQAWAQIKHDTLRIHWAEMGQPFDTLDYQDVMLEDSANVFFEASLRVSGTVSTILIMGAAGRIGLEDNIVYASSHDTTGQPHPGHPEKFALVSENEMKILNTIANGRENSSGQGNAQTNPAFTDIALNGIFVALNESFTFDQQNDADSGYVFCSGGQPGPDDRGQIFLWGSLMQHRRNYVHRSNCNSTGYLKQYRYDSDLRVWNFGLFDSTLRENLVEPTALNFGNVMVGDTVWDTVFVYNDFVPPWLTNIQTGTINFVIQSDSSGYDWVHALPVGFAPQAPEPLTDELTLDVPYYGRSISVPLTGTGIANAASDPFILPPSSFSLSAYPNPFNATTVFTFSVPATGHATLKLYDITGRVAATIFDGNASSGTQPVPFDARDLPSGLYVARLQTATAMTSTKVLLIK